MQGIIYFGVSFYCWFLEVCAGSAVLTRAMRCCGLTTMEPVDLSTGWDLTLRSHVTALKAKIKEYRPLVTHLAPVCRIFSTAFNPTNPDYASEEQYLLDMQLAFNICGIAEYILTLRLFLVIESVLRNRMYKLHCYVRLHQRAGMFYVDFNRCMNNYRHSATGELVWKGHRLLTNAPWMVSMGVLCDGTHDHTKLEFKYTKESQEYDWECA